MAPRNVLLVVTVLLCGRFLAASGQAPIINPLVIEGQEGSTVTFFCDSQTTLGGQVILLEVFDEMDNIFISATDDRIMKQPDGQFANFTFGPLRATDNNTMYQCISARGRSEVAVISVIFAPIISRASPLGDPVTVKENQNIIVELNVSANPQPFFYQWTHLMDDMIEVVTNDNGITVSLSSVAFNAVLRRQSGVYTLVANNSAGSSEYNFTLDVQYPPRFPDEVISSDSFNCSRDGEMVLCASYPGVSATLFCDVTGNPLPTLSRSVSGVSDQSNIDLMTGRNITITSVNVNNAGTFNCTATSNVVSQPVKVTRTFYLYVGGVARALSDIEATIVEGEVVFTWSHDNSRDVNPVPAQYFVVTVYRNGMQINGSPFVIDVSMTSFTVQRNLVQPEQTFMASVIVRNLQGDSETVSESFTVPSGSSALATSSLYILSFCALVVIPLIL